MTAAEIKQYRDSNPHKQCTEFYSSNCAMIVGQFLSMENDNEGLKKINRYKIIENCNAEKYLESNSMEFLTVIDGDMLTALTASH